MERGHVHRNRPQSILAPCIFLRESFRQGEKVPAEDRSGIEPAISNLCEALKGDDKDAIQKAMQNLESSSHKVAEEMYKATAEQAAQAGGAGAAGAGAPGTGAPGAGPTGPAGGPEEDTGDDDVIDAEYEVKE